MKKHLNIAIIFGFALIFTLSCGEHSLEQLSFAENETGDEEFPTSDNPLLLQTVKLDYSVRSSADYFGDKYLLKWDPDSQHPSVSTFVNADGSVTVCVSDDNARVVYIYEFSMNLEELKRFTFTYEFDQFGAFTKDSEGNYYFFYAQEAGDVYTRDAANEPENMAMVKYDRNGNKIKIHKAKPYPTGYLSGVRWPFRTGCRLEISGSMLAVHFARAMFRGDNGTAHQGSYILVLNKDSLEPIDDRISWTSHSFNQFILPINDGFVFVDQGDANPQRAFGFSKYVYPNKKSRLYSFNFAFEGNTTNAQMGGLAKTSGGYIFAGTYGDVPNKRDLFTLTFNEAMTSISAPTYLTAYTEENVGGPKIVGIGSGQYLLLWESFKYPQKASSSQPSNYISTKVQIVDESGNPLSQVKDIEGMRLSMNDVLRYNPKNGRVYWAINDILEQQRQIIVYALDARYAYTDANIDNIPDDSFYDGYGFTLRRFNSDKTTVSKNEEFTIDHTLSYLSSESFPGVLSGVALMDGGGNIISILGTLNMAPVADLNRSNKKIKCKVPDDVASGQYKLRIVVKAEGKEEWHLVTISSVSGVSTIMDFTVQ